LRKSEREGAYKGKDRDLTPGSSQVWGEFHMPQSVLVVGYTVSAMSRYGLDKQLEITLVLVIKQKREQLFVSWKVLNKHRKSSSATFL
jgi:hypothetical protein